MGKGMNEQEHRQAEREERRELDTLVGVLGASESVQDAAERYHATDQVVKYVIDSDYGTSRSA